MHVCLHPLRCNLPSQTKRTNTVGDVQTTPVSPVKLCIDHFFFYKKKLAGRLDWILSQTIIHHLRAGSVSPSVFFLHAPRTSAPQLPRARRYHNLGASIKPYAPFSIWRSCPCRISGNCPTDGRPPDGRGCESTYPRKAAPIS